MQTNPQISTLWNSNSCHNFLLKKLFSPLSSRFSKVFPFEVMGQDLLLHQNVLFVMPLAKNAQKAQCGNLRMYYSYPTGRVRNPFLPTRLGKSSILMYFGNKLEGEKNLRISFFFPIGIKKIILFPCSEIFMWNHQQKNSCAGKKKRNSFSL